MQMNSIAFDVRSKLNCVLLVAALIGAQHAAWAGSVTLGASRDTTIYSENVNGSNAKGQLFAGRTAGTLGTELRRTLVAFDLSSIPSNATIQTVQLQLNCIKVPGGIPGPRDFDLCALTKTWGEGTSTGGGIPAQATPGDATWDFNVFNTASWTAPGGDFAAASATTSIDGLGVYTWTSAKMATDVQGWLANPATNNGWIIFGGEADLRTAKEFASREVGATGPSLTVTFTAPAVLGNFWIGDDATRGGNGTWLATGGTAWSATDADGQAGGGWDQSKTATFGGAVASSVVTVSGVVSANSGMLFTQTGYAINGAVGATLNLGGATPAINTITTNTGGAVISATLTGTNGLTKAGTGALALNGVNTYSGVTQISAGDLRGTGTLQGSTVTTAAAGNLWPGAATLGSQVPVAGETLTVNSLDMSAGGKLKIALNTSGTLSTQRVLVSGASCKLGGTLSLGIPAGASSANAYTVVSSTSAITGTFATVLLNGVTVTGASPVSVQYTANAVTVTITGSVTPVTIGAFEAKAEGAGVLVKWECVSEFQNVGFHVYRRVLGENFWERINEAMIPGRITNPEAKTYWVYDWAMPGAYEYRLDSIGLSGGVETYEKIAGPVEIGVDAEEVSSTAVDTAVESIEVTQNLIQTRSAVLRFEDVRVSAAEQVVSVAGDTGSKLPLPVPHSGVGVRWFSSAKTGGASAFNAAKLVYEKSGVLFVPQAALPAGYDAQHVAVQREGRGVTALAATPGGLLLYGRGYQDDYTNKDAFFLRRTAAATSAGSVAPAKGLFSSSMPLYVSTRNVVTAEFNDVYFDFDLRPYNYAPWFSQKYLTQGTTQTFALETPGALPNSATLTVNVWSLTESSASPDHALQVLVNGQPAGQTQWDGGGKMMQLVFTVPAGVLQNGANQIALVTPALNGVEGQIAFVYSMSLSYKRALNASQPIKVLNTGTAAWLFEAYGLPSANAWVVDARFSDRAALVPSEAQAQADGTYRLRFVAAAGGSGEFLIVPAGMENRPIVVSERRVAPLRGSVYLATGPVQFGAGVQPLLLQHSREGLRGAFVDQEQLFDYYSHGRYGPAGIQAAVRATRPQYLLLVGRTTYDYLNRSGANVDPLCPTFLVSTSFWAQATSDSMFGDLGRGYPEVAVGRLPVNNVAELNGAVRRVVSYSGAPESGIRVHAIADRSDPLAGEFGAQTDTLSQANPELTWQRNYLGVTAQSAPEITVAMTAAANGGADWLLYVGHGNSARLGAGDPRILQADAQHDNVKDWTGSAVLMQATCAANWMAGNSTGFHSIATQALSQPQGGISASIASSTYMNSDCAVEFMGQLMRTANTSGMRWGTALMKSQQWAFTKGGGFYRDLTTTEQMFGDPAMRVFSRRLPGAGSAAPAAGQF